MTERERLMKSIQEKEARLKDAMNPNIEEKTHPDVGMGERWRGTLFAKDIRTIVATAQEDHPDLDVIEHKGRVLFRDKGVSTGNKWNVFDPDTGAISTDIIGDLGDVAYDALSTGAEIAGGIGGAIAGGVSTAPIGGVGAIPGGMAGAAAAGAGMEGIRQLIGKYAGLKQDVSGTDMAISGGLAGLGTLVGGAGGAGKALMKKGANKMISKVAQGGIGYGAANMATRKAKLFSKIIYDSVTETMPRAVADILTGIKASTWNDYLNNPETIKLIDKLGVAGYSEKEIKHLFDNVHAAKVAASKNYAKFAKSKEQVDIKEVKKVFNKYKDSLVSMRKRGINKSQNKALSEIDKIIDDVFTVKKEGLDLPADTSFSEPGTMAKVNKAERELNKSMDDIKAMIDPSKETMQKQLVEGSERATRSLPSVREMLEKVQSNQKAARLEQLLTSTDERKLAPPQKPPTYIREIPMPDKIDVDQMYGVRDAIDEAAKWNSIGKLPARKKQTIGVAGDAKSKLTDEMTKQIKPKQGLNYGETGEMYSKANESEQFIKNKLLNSGKRLDEGGTYNIKGHSYVNKAGKGDQARMEELELLDKMWGTNLAKTAKMEAAHGKLRKAPWSAQSKGKVNKGRLGGTAALSAGAGYAGYVLGGKEGAGIGGGIGAGIGVGVGLLSGSPKIWKAALKTMATPKQAASTTADLAKNVAKKAGMTNAKAKQYVLRGLLKAAQQEERDVRTPEQDKSLNKKSSAALNWLKQEFNK